MSAGSVSRRAPWLVALAAAIVFVAGAVAWVRGGSDSAAADTAGGMPASAQIEDRYGVRIVGAYLTAANGMIEIQYQVLDKDKAQEIASETVSPVLEAHGTVFDAPGLAGHGHTHHVPEAGHNGFVLLANSKGELHEGDVVNVRMGDLTLKGVTLE
jgi:hypothetical protein